MNITDLTDPKFLGWIDKVHGGRIEPDPQDFDHSADARLLHQQAEQYRLAQARKLMRLYKEWNASFAKWQ